MDAITSEAAPVVETNIETPVQEAPVYTRTIEPSSLDMDQPTALPEKFRGKGLDEIAKSYTNLESEFHKKSAQIKDLEQKASRADQLEQVLWQQQVAQQQQQSQAVQSTQINPNDQFNQLWERDPASAVLTKTHDMERRFEYAMQDLNTRAYYNEVRNTRPDFAQLEPEMMKIATEYLPLLRPEAISSPRTIDALYNMAQARTIDARMRSAKDRGMQEATRVEREKHNAFAEGSSSSQGSTVPFELLSLQEMAKSLGRVER